MIKSFACEETKKISEGKTSTVVPNQIRRSAQRKLQMIKAAVVLSDLKAPPGNHLEALKGDRAGQHSIRINTQWRICFVWEGNGASDVEIVDYH